MGKVLIVAAHPDDDILGCGGFIARYAKKYVFRVIFIAEGSSCRYGCAESCSADVRKVIEQRNNFGKKALSVLGVSDLAFYDLPCGRLDQEPLIDIGKIIENEIRMFKPTIIFTHSEMDVNNDHKLVFQATLQATRPGAQNLVGKLYTFEVLSSSEWQFVDSFMPNFFVTLSEKEILLKIKALEEYVTEQRNFPFPRSKEGLLTQAKYRGMQCASNYAEAFRLVREIR